MIDYNTFQQIKYLYQHHGLKCTQIAEKLDLDDRTVDKWLQENQFRQRKKTQRSSKLNPFKDDIIRMLETHPYTAVQIFQRICDDGFDGGYTIVKQYVRKVRPRRAKAFLTLSFAPGECATRSIGAATARSVWGRPPADSAFLSWCCVTAG